MLRTLALAAAFAAPTVDLPELFQRDLARIAPRTGVPILLPQAMPDEFDRYVPSGSGRERRGSLQLGAVEGCGGATAAPSPRSKGAAAGAAGPGCVTLARGASAASTPARRATSRCPRSRGGARRDLPHPGEGEE